MVASWLGDWMTGTCSLMLTGTIYRQVKTLPGRLCLGQEVPWRKRGHWETEVGVASPGETLSVLSLRKVHFLF